MNSAQLS